MLWFFFFKQKTAYEVRISDWSSDVCSSDLFRVAHVLVQPVFQGLEQAKAAGLGGGARGGSFGAAVDDLLSQFAKRRAGNRDPAQIRGEPDRKGTRLNSSH